MTEETEESDWIGMYIKDRAGKTPKGLYVRSEGKRKGFYLRPFTMMERT